MDKIWEIAGAIIISVGGAGTIVTGIVYFCSRIIVKRLQKKYELSLDEKFEKYKATVENKKYITKVRFDAEFKIYRELSESFFEMVKSISILIPQGLTMVPADKETKEKRDIENYGDALKAVEKAQDVLNSNAPFIPKEIFDKYDEIRILCMKQLNDFSERWNVSVRGTKKEKETLSHETYKRTGEIDKKFKEINGEIREYLESLDVLE